MTGKLLDLLRGVPDHVWALVVVVLGVAVSFASDPHGLAPTLIAAGLTMWRGQDK